MFSPYFTILQIFFNFIKDHSQLSCSQGLRTKWGSCQQMLYSLMLLWPWFSKNFEIFCNFLFLFLWFFQTNSPDERKTHQWLRKHYGGVGNSGLYINHREVQLRCLLEPGHYVVIPTTFDPGRECSFILRIFSENPITCKSFTNI